MQRTLTELGNNVVNPRVWYVVPARSGSKGIPEKNLTYFNDLDLVSLCLNKLTELTDPVNVILTTNDQEIVDIGQRYGALVRFRDPELASDETTLDPVVYDAIDSRKLDEDDIVVTVQVTSPNVQVETIRNAIRYYRKNNLDTLISGREEHHLTWRKLDGKFVPNYSQRKNRQELPATYTETGAFLITRAKFITSSNRIGANVELYPLSKAEAEDIDDRTDYAVALANKNNSKIAIHVIGSSQVGTGHIFNCIEIARRLPDHEIRFFVEPKDDLAVKILKQRHYPITVTNDLVRDIVAYEPKTLIIDALDTSVENIIKYKNCIPNVVSFEDLGSGSHYTDYTFNALYPTALSRGNIKSGPEFFIKRADFNSINTTRNVERDVLIFLGGTDPMKHSESVLEMCEKSKWQNVTFTLLAGIGKQLSEELHNKLRSLDNVKLLSFTPSIKEILNNHTISITSGGRTMYELSSLKLPFIVLFQNNREKLHFEEVKRRTDVKGFDQVDADFENLLMRLINDERYRKKLTDEISTLNVGSKINEIIKTLRG